MLVLPRVLLIVSSEVSSLFVMLTIYCNTGVSENGGNQLHSIQSPSCSHDKSLTAASIPDNEGNVK